MTKHLLLFAAVGITLVGNAHGYGNAGHQVIGTIAQHYLLGTRAEKEILALLRKGEGLDRAATWADRAKLPEKYLSDEMKDFVTNNPEHHSYHYCDVPFQEKAYREGITGTNKNDIVHTLKACIEVLQKPEDDAANPLKINKRVALMLVSHFIGDLHQPLHVGCSYIDEKDQYVNPETGAKGQPDAGANYLHIKTRSGSPLHGYWDTLTVKASREQCGNEDYSVFITRLSPPQPDWDATGPATTWPEQWASDTLSLSKLCFQGLVPRDRFLVPKDEKHEEYFEWLVTLPEDYTIRSRDIVNVELSKAGYRLAILLKAIWPDQPVEK